MKLYACTRSRKPQIYDIPVIIDLRQTRFSVMQHPCLAGSVVLRERCVREQVQSDQDFSDFNWSSASARNFLLNAGFVLMDFSKLLMALALSFMASKH